jgi:hypothetical protein
MYASQLHFDFFQRTEGINITYPLPLGFRRKRRECSPPGKHRKITVDKDEDPDKPLNVADLGPEASETKSTRTQSARCSGEVARYGNGELGSRAI